MNRKRIEEAIEILRNVPRGKFDLTSWAYLKDEELGRFDPDDPYVLNGCGTTGCACGWIASDPRARRRGLRLWVPHPDTYRAALSYKPPGSDSVPFYDTDAAMAYFDISHDAATWLFMPEQYHRRDWKRPSAVRRRLEKLLERGEEAVPVRH